MIVVTRCQILRQKCTKFDFGWGSGPLRPRWGSLAGFKGPTSKGRQGMGWEVEGRLVVGELLQGLSGG